MIMLFVLAGSLCIVGALACRELEEWQSRRQCRLGHAQCRISDTLLALQRSLCYCRWLDGYGNEPQFWTEEAFVKRGYRTYPEVDQNLREYKAAKAACDRSIAWQVVFHGCSYAAWIGWGACVIAIVIVRL